MPRFRAALSGLFEYSRSVREEVSTIPRHPWRPLIKRVHGHHPPSLLKSIVYLMIHMEVIRPPPI
jgi:hypothetical protein